MSCCEDGNAPAAVHKPIAKRTRLATLKALELGVSMARYESGKFNLD